MAKLYTSDAVQGWMRRPKAEPQAQRYRDPYGKLRPKDTAESPAGTRSGWIQELGNLGLHPVLPLPSCVTLPVSFNGSGSHLPPL